MACSPVNPKPGLSPLGPKSYSMGSKLINAPLLQHQQHHQQQQQQQYQQYQPQPQQRQGPHDYSILDSSSVSAKLSAFGGNASDAGGGVSSPSSLSHKTGDFEDGLMDCGNGQCRGSCFCTCLPIAHVSHVIGCEVPYEAVLLIGLVWGIASAFSLGVGGYFGFAVMTFWLRTTFRRAYQVSR